MQRPKSVTVFGILNIVFAAFGIIGAITSLVLLLAPLAPNDPFIKIMHENPAYAIWYKLEIPLGILSRAALLAAGIGLLSLKSWARTLSMAYAIYAILLGILETALTFMVYRPMVEKLQGPVCRQRRRRDDRWEHWHMPQPGLSDPAAHLHVAPNRDGGVSSACSVPGVGYPAGANTNAHPAQIVSVNENRIGVSSAR